MTGRQMPARNPRARVVAAAYRSLGQVLSTWSVANDQDDTGMVLLLTQHLADLARRMAGLPPVNQGHLDGLNVLLDDRQRELGLTDLEMGQFVLNELALRYILLHGGGAGSNVEGVHGA